MEGQSLLFKRLADIDAFNLELDAVHREEFGMRAAVRTGVASRPVKDLTAYADAVATRVCLSREEHIHLGPAQAGAYRG